jgi:hypothetical protein
MAQDDVRTFLIDPDGDVLLEVSGLAEKSRLRVSSSILSLASSVFKKMFQSGFKEGHGLSSTNPRSIPLPEDDGEGVTVVCNILHHRVDDVPLDIATDCLISIATICDKYELARVIAPWSSIWLRRQTETAVGDDLNRLLSAAYVLDIPDAFSSISWKMLYSHTGPFLGFPGITDHELLPYGVLGMSQKLGPSFQLTQYRNVRGQKGRSRIVYHRRNRRYNFGLRPGVM